MSDTKLRKAIIRLAHEQPGLRDDLLPLLRNAAGLPRATRRPAGEKFRMAVQRWAYEEIRSTLKGLGREQISMAQHTVDTAVERSDWRDPMFATQIEIMDWIQGKTKIDGKKLGMGGTWSKFGQSFSFPDVLKAYQARFGGAGTAQLAAQVTALAKQLDSTQLALAATIFAPSSYGNSQAVENSIASGLDDDAALLWLKILEWVKKNSDYPSTRFN